MANILLTGIADEAGGDIETQIGAHRELGWNAIEVRMIDGNNATGDLPRADFDRAAEAIEAAGLQVVGFASAIGNWSRNINDDFQRDVDELKTAIPRMQRFGTRFIRIMSWVGEGVAEDAWRDEAVRRCRELARIAADGGVWLAHENCTGWGGLSGKNMRALIEAVDSPHFVALYDTGNPVSYGLDPMAFYREVKDLIRYVHIKDARRNPEGEPSSDYTYPGEGDGCVREILSDLIAAGYEGIASIEPHVASIVHSGEVKAAPEEIRASYLRYGRKAAELLAALS